MNRNRFICEFVEIIQCRWPLGFIKFWKVWRTNRSIIMRSVNKEYVNLYYDVSNRLCFKSIFFLSAGGGNITDNDVDNAIKSGNLFDILFGYNRALQVDYNHHIFCDSTYLFVVDESTTRSARVIRRYSIEAWRY